MQCQGKCIEREKKSWENFPLNIFGKFVGCKSQILDLFSFCTKFNKRGSCSFCDCALCSVHPILAKFLFIFKHRVLDFSIRISLVIIKTEMLNSPRVSL
jgi:hypothetical protein